MTTLLEVRLVKLPLGLVIEVTALIVLALTFPLAEILLAVRLVKLPMGLVTEVTALIVLELMAPLALMLPSTVNFSLGLVVPMPTRPNA